MRFGTFLEMPRPPGWSEADTFQNALAHVDLAEAMGLDIVDVAEFHFTPERVVSSPLALAAAIAGRTKHIRVGTSVLVLPLGNPIRMAEETATIDHLSGGRFEVGVGRSGFQVAYEGYGIAYAESRDRFKEALDVMLGAWTNECFSYHGTHYSYDNVCLVPRPLQQPHPPVRIAASSDETFPMNGKLGFPLLVGLRQVPLAKVAEQAASYREAWLAAGHQSTPDISLRIPVYLAETHEAAVEEAEESFMRQFRRVGAQMSESATKVGDAGARRAEMGAALGALTWDEVVRERVIVGTPDGAIDRIEMLREALGVTEIVGEFNAGEIIPPPAVERSLRLFGERVAPTFR